MLVLRPPSTKQYILAVGEVEVVDVEEGISVIVFGCPAELRTPNVAACRQPVRCLPLAYRIEAFQGHLT